MKILTKIYLLSILVITAQALILHYANIGELNKDQFLFFQIILVIMAIIILRALYKYHQANRKFDYQLHDFKMRLNEMMIHEIYGDLGGRWINKIDGNHRVIHIYEQRREKCINNE